MARGDYDPNEVASQIYHLRKAGVSFTEIHQDYMKGVVSYDQMISLYRSFEVKMAQSYGTDERRQMLFLELERLDALQQAVWVPAISGDLKAGAQALNVIKTRIGLLQLDQLAATDKNAVNAIVLVGGEQRDYIEALRHARQIGVGSHGRDDEDGSEE